jgi:hypothetical protein
VERAVAAAAPPLGFVPPPHAGARALGLLAAPALTAWLRCRSHQFTIEEIRERMNYKFNIRNLSCVHRAAPLCSLCILQRVSSSA